MKYFEFRKLTNNKPDRPAQYWSSSLSVAQHLYKQLEGKALTNKEIKKLWKTTGPDNWANRFLFGPDYDGIKSYYKMMGLGLSHVQQKIADSLDKLGEMTEDELEVEDSIIREARQRDFKENSNIEFQKLTNVESNTEIEVFKSKSSKYKL
jgi:polyhydroxyalkanoate synthesis regulator phasin